MKVVQRFLCFLSPLIVTGHALTCTSCVSLNACEPNCTSDSTVQCSSSELCATAYRNKSENGKVTYDLIRTCAPKEKCEKVGGFSYSNVKMTMGVGCCSTDRCTPDLPQLTQDSSASNNIQCGTCSSSSMDCHPTESMTCTGQETRCVAYSQTMSGEASVYQGCGSQSLCDIQEYTAKAFGVTVKHSFTCAKQVAASCGGIAPGHFLIALMCVILMNHSV